MAFFLSFKEVWRNRGRFTLFSLVIALITLLVLFIAALSEGLALANKEYLSKLDADLLVFQKNVELSANASRLDRSLLNDIQRLDVVANAGPLGFGNGTLVFTDGRENEDVSLIGVEAGKPGLPPVTGGLTLTSDRGNDVVIDGNIASRQNVSVGDTITIKTIKGSEEEFFQLNVIGITEGQQYLYAPSIFIPYRTWEQINSQMPGGLMQTIANVIVVKFEPGVTEEAGKASLLSQVANIEVADTKTAYEAIPGYSVQQTTLNTQSGFTLLIGILVIGGFFQIQLLQKVPQIGVLKAIGTSNSTVAATVVMQIVLVSTFGVLLGGAVTLLLAAFIPASVPIVFAGGNVLLAVILLLLIGPVGGLVSVRLAISVEPLIALGLSS